MTTLTEKIEAWLLEPGLTRHSDIRAFAKKIDEEYELVEKSPELEALKRYKKSVESEVGKSECEDGLCVGGGGVICKKHFQQAYEKLWGPEVEKKECNHDWQKLDGTERDMQCSKCKYFLIYPKVEYKKSTPPQGEKEECFAPPLQHAFLGKMCPCQPLEGHQPKQDTNTPCEHENEDYKEGVYELSCKKCGWTMGAGPEGIAGYYKSKPPPPVLPELPEIEEIENFRTKPGHMAHDIELTNKINELVKAYTALRASKECNTKE